MSMTLRLGGAPAAPAAAVAVPVPVVGAPTSPIVQVLAGQSRTEIAHLVPVGASVAGGGYNQLTDTNYGGAADGGGTGGTLFSTADLTEDGAIVPRIILPASAARTFAGFTYNRAGSGIALMVGPDPAAGATRRTMLGAVEMHDNVKVTAVIGSSVNNPVWAWWGMGYRVNSNGRWWGTGVWFFAQAQGGTGVAPQPGGTLNWATMIAADSVNIADPTPILYGPIDTGIPFAGWNRLGIIIDATSDAVPRVRWFINSVLVDTFAGPTATRFDANVNGLLSDLFFGYSCYKEDNTTTDSINIKWHVPGAVFARTLPVLP